MFPRNRRVGRFLVPLITSAGCAAMSCDDYVEPVSGGEFVRQPYLIARDGVLVHPPCDVPDSLRPGLRSEDGPAELRTITFVDAVLIEEGSAEEVGDISLGIVSHGQDFALLPATETISIALNSNVRESDPQRRASADFSFIDDPDPTLTFALLSAELTDECVAPPQVFDLLVPYQGVAQVISGDNVCNVALPSTPAAAASSLSSPGDKDGLGCFPITEWEGAFTALGIESSTFMD